MHTERENNNAKREKEIKAMREETRIQIENMKSQEFGVEIAVTWSWP